MANMSANQRAQYDRPELSVASTGVRVRDRRYPIAFTIIGLLVLGALGYATAVAIDGWPRAVVLVMIVVTTIGLMIAISPNRRA